MKRLFLSCALLAVTALIVSSCTSPTDVPAGRKETKDPVQPPLIIQKKVDLGSVKPHADHPFAVEIHNTSATAEVIITDVSLKFGDRGFTFVSPDLPYTLGPRGTNDVLSISGFFTSPSSPGEYRDEIIINNDPALACEVVAVVNPPAVFIDDIDFGTLEFGTKKDFNARITNNGDAPATLLSVNLQSPSEGSADYFVLHPYPPLILPLDIPAGTFTEIRVVFNSLLQSAQVTGTISLDINYQGSGTVDNTAILTGEVLP